MNNDQLLAQWLQAAIEAYCDFVAQSFFIEEFPDPNNLEIKCLDHLNVLHDLNGAAIELSLNNKKITLVFLAKEEGLAYITGRILCTSEHETLERSDIIDAIKEVINVIAGGVKSRLSNEQEGEIILGLPVYIDKFIMDMDKSSSVILGSFNFDNIEIFLLISSVDTN